MLQLEETGELLDPQEKADIEKHMTKDKLADDEVVVAVRSLAKELQEQRHKPGQSASSRDASKRARRYLAKVEVPDTDIPKACLQFLPPGCSIYPDHPRCA